MPRAANPPTRHFLRARNSGLAPASQPAAMGSNSKSKPTAAALEKEKEKKKKSKRQKTGPIKVDTAAVAALFASSV